MERAESVGKAVFLDRDGVLIKDTNLLTQITDIVFEPAVAQALELLQIAGYMLLVVTNQTVISRGLASEEEVMAIHEYINAELNNRIEKFYYCPHHPNANLEQYRKDCWCRKPRAGMLFTAAAEFNIDLAGSWMIGDRISDIVAGKNAGCKTIQVLTGAHREKPIMSAAMPEYLPEPDYSVTNLLDASKIILEKSK